VKRNPARSAQYPHLPQARDYTILAIPPGGLLWMGEATRQALDQAMPLLQSGQPVIFRLVRSLKNLVENRQVIVYAWQGTACWTRSARNTISP